MAADSFYSLQTTSLDGKPADLSKFRGQVTLAVNVASQCGFTPQYKGLEKLHEEFSPKGFSVLGFPSNDFGGQEPGSPQEIQTFCETKFGVRFPLFAKLATKPGKDQSPLYAFLAESGNAPNWNFCKYLIGKDGRVRAFFPSKVAPDSPQLREAVEAALRA
mgnify:CR=1 FL=1